jgi:hypothetical protein
VKDVEGGSFTGPYGEVLHATPTRWLNSSAVRLETAVLYVRMCVGASGDCVCAYAWLRVCVCVCVCVRVFDKKRERERAFKKEKLVFVLVMMRCGDQVEIKQNKCENEIGQTMHVEACMHACVHACMHACQNIDSGHKVYRVPTVGRRSHVINQVPWLDFGVTTRPIYIYIYI